MKTNSIDNDFCSLIEVLNRFDFAFFSLAENKLFQMEGKVPGWLQDIFPKRDFHKKKMRAESVFPFLDDFMSDAFEFWERKNSGKIHSDYWIEQGKDGTEYNLQAHVLNISEKNVLLIGTQRDWIEHKREILQKGRELKLAYEELERTRDDLKKMIEIKDQFVTMVAHDIKSPLASVVGASRLILHEDEALKKLTVFQREMMQEVYAQLNRVFEYIDRLYYWTKTSVGELEVSKRDKNVTDLVQESVKIFKQKIDEKQINLKLNLSYFEIHVDEVLFLQVINNLLNNAIKFSHIGGEITITAFQDQKQSIIEVSDKGVGMSSEQKELLFSNMKNKSTVGTDGEKGSGLGLNIVKKILDLHDAEFSIESTVDKGTTIRIVLPD